MFHFAATTHIGLVHKDEIPVAAMWIVTDRERATDPWAGSRRAYWNQCPNNLLYWGGITWAIENGLKTFDFGRSIRNSGHAHFKLQWGAEELPLYYYYLLNRADHPPELSPDKKSLQLAAGLWRKLPGSLVRRIGPHLIKRLPS